MEEYARHATLEDIMILPHQAAKDIDPAWFEDGETATWPIAPCLNARWKCTDGRSRNDGRPAPRVREFSEGKEQQQGRITRVRIQRRIDLPRCCREITDLADCLGATEERGMQIGARGEGASEEPCCAGELSHLHACLSEPRSCTARPRPRQQPHAPSDVGPDLVDVRLRHPT